KIYLPRSTGVQETEFETLMNVPVTGGDEKVLIVEDDTLVRQYVAAQVRSLGYTALEAANGADALAIIDAHDDIDLLFTDVIMPGNMNGR
ncbi:response regulator, partial [Acinetobacter baumannii]